LLIPALRSSSIRPEEEALRAALEEIDGEIRRPGGMGRIVGKLNELWALVGAVNAVRGNSKGSTDGVEWAVVDEDGLNQIVQVRPSARARAVPPARSGETLITNPCFRRFWGINRLG
jgi:nuclear pore complex protein Nup54